MIRRVTGFGIIALVAVGLGIFGLIFSSLQLVQGTHSLINSVKPEPASDIIRLTQEVSSLQREVARLQLQIRGTPSP